MERVRQAWVAVRERIRWQGLLFILVLIVVFLSVGLGVSVVIWNWPAIENSDWEDRLSIVRDVGIFGATIFALIFTAWRGWAADRQAGAAQDRADTAQRVLLNDRYQKGAEMLGRGVLAVRLGGIYALGRLAKEYPSDYHIQVMGLLCAFARRPPGAILTEDADSIASGGNDRMLRPRQDVQAVLWTIGDRGKVQRELERVTEERFDLDLSGLQLAGGKAEQADLAGANLRDAQLSRVDFTDVNLSSAQLQRSNLSLAILSKANLFYAQLWHAHMPGAELSGANMWEAELLGANLTDGNLRGADLWKADLSGANLENANLSGAGLRATDLSDSSLSGVELIGAIMNGAVLRNANLSGARLSRFGRHPVVGLTQKQLDEAVADRHNPPRLVSVVDAVTGRELIWRGGPPRS